MPKDDRVEQLAKRLRQDNKPFAVATVVRTEKATSAKAGAKAVVREDGAIDGWIGGGCAQPAVRQAARQAIRDGRSRLIRVRPDTGEGGEGIEVYPAHCHSGGTLDIFIEPMLPRLSLLILGASPAAQTLARLAHEIGYAVTAAAPAAHESVFPGADRVIDGYDLGDGAASIAGFVVVASQGRGDRPALEAALTTDAGFIAFIASRRKAEEVKRELVAGGADPARVAAIRSPAGLDIGAVTPEEIAVAVLAEIVRERRSAADPHRDVPDTAGVAVEETMVAEPPLCGGTDTN